MSEAKEGGEAPAKKKPPVAIIAVAAVALVGGGTFVFGKTVGAKSAKPAPEPPGFRLKLDEMVVNLKGDNQFIKATPEVEFKKPGAGGEKAAEKFAEFTSRIEGAITLVFRATPVDALDSGEGIEKVQHKMVATINKAIKESDGKVKEVTIGKFATQ
jgi:flagellar basal body-associated protein FliL